MSILFNINLFQFYFRKNVLASNNIVYHSYITSKKIVQFDWLRENRSNDLNYYFHDV